MMQYAPLPLDMIELGQILPVDVWVPHGVLLLRRGQTITSEHHKETLRTHHAAITTGDAQAWQRSYERMIAAMIKDGVPMAIIAKAPMPTEIWESDYRVGREVHGDWLDLQEMLLGLLYQGEAAITPLPRLEGIEFRAIELLQGDPEASLFVLFQALADLTLGYSATHALLTAVVCELTTEKLGMPAPTRRILFRCALTMNIGMARAQGTLARQDSAPSEDQRKLIKDHPPKGYEILQGFGVRDEDQLDIVHWHHDLDESNGLARNLHSRRILRMADSFVAKMAPRKTRLAMSPLGAVKALLAGAAADTEKFGSAMATAVGFYPPGTYVLLANGEKAVVIARGSRANNPHAACIVNAAGIPLSKYIYRDTSQPQFAVRSPINADHIKVKVSLEKIARVRHDHPA
jgi:HD-GYP domain-containing protein (c-di-GMP phosphodiesterase class II)